MRQMLIVMCMVVAAGSMMVMVGGCESESKYITAEEIRDDLSPEYFTTLRSWDQRENYDAITRDLNTRQLVDDWYTFWQAKPSRLTPYPNLY